MRDKKIQRIYHPKTKHLTFDIFKTQWKGVVGFYFEEGSDIYTKDWCKNPLQECITDAHRVLGQIYKGTYWDSSIEHREYNSDDFLPY